ncbi:MAG: peptidyl-prolyl cis-trans isomerase SurA [Candidatus Omnitrophota bacterium]|jgi:peptidyl-prolyl cis-trans isomerase SurA
MKILAQWILLCGFVCVATGQLLPPEQLPISVDGYAAIVNERIITASDVMTLIAPERQRILEDPTLNNTGKQEALRGLYDKGLRNLVERSLTLEAFELTEMQIPDKLVNDRVTEIINRRFNNDQALFERTLSQEGISMTDWREQTKEQLIIQMMRRQEVYSRLAVSPRQIRELYEVRIKDFKVEAAVELRVIARNRPGTKDERLDVLRSLYRVQLEVKDGADFIAACKEHSEGPKVESGGDLGWMQLNQMRAEWRDAIADVPAGGVSNVVRDGDMYYLFKVEDRKEGAVKPLSEMHEELEAELLAGEEKVLYEDWMTRLRNKFHVKIY